MGGKTRTDSGGEVPKGWDHDPPATTKLVPFGILMVATGALMLVFGTRDTSDAWVDALKRWWLQVREGLGHIKRLVNHHQTESDRTAGKIIAVGRLSISWGSPPAVPTAFRGGPGA